VGVLGYHITTHNTVVHTTVVGQTARPHCLVFIHIHIFSRFCNMHYRETPRHMLVSSMSSLALSAYPQTLYPRLIRLSASSAASRCFGCTCTRCGSSHRGLSHKCAMRVPHARRGDALFFAFAGHFLTPGPRMDYLRSSQDPSRQQQTS
jgi:hypothetical protein